MLSLVAAALLATSPSEPPAPFADPALVRRPVVLRDAALAFGASAAVALGKPDIRRAILRDGRVGNVIENFAHPVAQVRTGTRRDVDPFWVNGIAHPVSFAAEALYLKRQGYGNGSAFLFTQVHSVLWEFMVEGCAFEPSGKDLLTDAAGAAAAIWIVDPLLSRLTSRRTAAHVSVGPTRGGMALSISF